MPANEIMRKINKKAIGALAVTAALLGTGGTMAYLTDYASTVNEFTVGKVTIDLKEPGWKPDEHTSLLPSETIAKDPQITNTGLNDAYVYLEVSVPVKNIITADDAGHRKPQADTPLFSFTPGSDWTELEQKTEDSAVTYLYSYNQVLPPEGTTSPLFHEVTFANLIEGQLDAQKLDMPVRAYAIQTAGTGGDSSDIPAQAAAAWQKYINQNPEGEL